MAKKLCAVSLVSQTNVAVVFFLSILCNIAKVGSHKWGGFLKLREKLIFVDNIPFIRFSVMFYSKNKFFRKTQKNTFITINDGNYMRLGKFITKILKKCIFFPKLCRNLNAPVLQVLLPYMLWVLCRSPRHAKPQHIVSLLTILYSSDRCSPSSDRCSPSSVLFGLCSPSSVPL